MGGLGFSLSPSLSLCLFPGKACGNKRDGIYEKMTAARSRCDSWQDCFPVHSTVVALVRGGRYTRHEPLAEGVTFKVTQRGHKYVAIPTVVLARILGPGCPQPGPSTHEGSRSQRPRNLRADLGARVPPAFWGCTWSQGSRVWDLSPKISLHGPSKRSKVGMSMMKTRQSCEGRGWVRDRK